MMELITGQPGNGKTLYALKTIETRRQAENRPVYYHGIPDLTLPWFRLENPEEWHLLPEGAIIVIDECQKTFPPRPSASKPPLHVSEFETHRHKGYDIYLLTQHPSLVDNHLKKLAGKHHHVIRSFGMERADVFSMQSVMDPSARNLKDAQRKQFIYPPEVYDWYKSSDLHTHKRKLPWQYYAIPVSVLVVIAAAFGGYNMLIKMGKTGVDAVSTVPKSVGHAPTQNGMMGDQQKHVLTSAEYLALHQPRIDGLAYTAPVYDDVTKPEEAPLPVACIQSKTQGCRCYSQQGTRLQMPDLICNSIVQNGFFQSFVPRSQQAKSVDAGTQGGSVAARHEPPSVRRANAA